jgi:heat shock protein HslJ
MRYHAPWLLAALVAACSSSRPHNSPADSAQASSPATPDTASAPASAVSAPLENTDWRLTEVGGAPVAAAADTAKRPGLRLVADGHKVQGSAGCNRMMGTYQLTDSSLKFGPLATTRMACPSMQGEQAYLAALGATTRYEIAGSTLTLFGKDGPVAKFEATNGPPK